VGDCVVLDGFDGGALDDDHVVGGS